MTIFNSQKLNDSKQHLYQGAYKLGQASGSLLYMSYPISMLAVQVAIGYGACYLADYWSSSTYNSNNHNAKLISSIYKNLGYSYKQGPTYFSDQAAEIIFKTFEDFSPYCYSVSIACAIMQNPQHAENLYNGGSALTKNLLGAAFSLAKGLYSLGSSVYDAPNEKVDIPDHGYESLELVGDTSSLLAA
jgi:hypothetical protein